MIFFLENEPQINETTLLALENIATAGRMGNHVVIGERRTLLSLANTVDLSTYARTYYRSRSQVVSQSGAQLRDFHPLHIDCADASTQSNSHNVPLGIFSNSDYCERSQLITENLDDSNVLISLARASMAHQGFRLQLRSLNGGGSTTAKVIEQTAGEPSGPVLCIVDSDKKYAESGLGQTALAAMRSANEVNEKWRFRLETLSSRELENLVPDEISERVLSNSHGKHDLVERLSQFESHVRSFCCLKKGDSVCRMIDHAEGKGHRHSVVALSETRDSMLAGTDRCASCPDGPCTSTPAFGARFLSHVAEFLKLGTYKAASDQWNSELRDLLELVINFGLADQPLRSL